MVSIRRSWRAALVLASSVLTATAHAEEPGNVVDDAALAALVEEALARNPDVAAAREALAASRARPQQAEALPDPVLSLAYTNDGLSPSLGSRDMTTLGVMWSQDLPFPGKRALRGRIAALEADAGEQRLERVRLSVAASVRRAYAALLLTRELAALVREQGALWQEIEGVARARYAVGQGAQQDVLRVQVEITRIAQLAAEQEVEAQVRRAELNRLLDRPADAVLDTAARLALGSAPSPLDAALTRAEAVSPEWKAVRLAVERARAALALARKQRAPDFTVQAGYMNRGRLDPMWQAGVGVRLPVSRNKIAGGIAEAEARLRESERGVEAVRLQLRYRTQQRVAQLEAAQRIATLYERGLIPQERMAVEAGIASYQAGRTPFVTVLEALVQLYTDRASYLRLLAAAAGTHAALAEASLESTSDLPVAALSTLGSTSRGGGAEAGGMPGGSMGNQ